MKVAVNLVTIWSSEGGHVGFHLKICLFCAKVESNDIPLYVSVNKD